MAARLRRREDPEQLQVLSQLLAVVANALAAEHLVDPALLATSSDLQELVRWRMGRSGAAETPALLQGWRGRILGEPLQEILDGRRSIRVSDLSSPNPFTVDPPRGEP